MALIKDREFVDEPVEVDDTKFFRCTFTRCTLVYSGGAHPAFDACGFNQVQFEFAGAAGRTLAFLQGLYHTPFKPQVEITLEDMKAGRSTPKADFASKRDASK